LDRATQRDTFQDLKRIAHSTMLCCCSPSVIKEHHFKQYMPEKAALMYCSPLPRLFVLKFKMPDKEANSHAKVK
jgi:hypothetical protein